MFSTQQHSTFEWVTVSKYIPTIRQAVWFVRFPSIRRSFISRSLWLVDSMTFMLAVWLSLTLMTVLAPAPMMATLSLSITIGPQTLYVPSQR
ncbi:hypothetical protein ES703_94712 [subsurface metagenome]